MAFGSIFARNTKRDNIRIETKVEDLEFTNEGNLI